MSALKQALQQELGRTVEFGLDPKDVRFLKQLDKVRGVAEDAAGVEGDLHELNRQIGNATSSPAYFKHKATMDRIIGQLERAEALALQASDMLGGTLGDIQQLGTKLKAR